MYLIQKSIRTYQVLLKGLKICEKKGSAVTVYTFVNQKQKNYKQCILHVKRLLVMCQHLPPPYPSFLHLPVKIRELQAMTTMVENQKIFNLFNKFTYL